MVESALEFVRICERYGYRDLVLSMKASNPLVMIQAYRLLAARMAELGMDYPFHLGVTEAGDGVDGRIKSAVGIGSLLEDGIGDTIRVSLTEDPVEEIPVAYQLAKKYNDYLLRNEEGEYGSMGVWEYGSINVTSSTPPHPPTPTRDPYTYSRQKTREIDLSGLKVGNAHPARVEVAVTAPLSNVQAVLHQINQLTNPGSNQGPSCEIVQLFLNKETEVGYVMEIAEGLQVPLALKISSTIMDLYPIQPILPQTAKIILSPNPWLSKSDWKSQTLSYIQLAKTYQKPIQWNVGEDQIPKFILQTQGKTPEGLVETCWQLVQLCLEQDYKDILLSLETPQMIYAYRMLVDRLDSIEADFPL
ncbi:MAG: flavodoxin-dependent (E)-4-hydroxy-3-methylbut-2-enyl-diphosphate synthase, partial [Nitrospira sp.]|nr:flavodoxin-dependent (E)-4-hydroxy-3-methylbut-2-enyl-diphosphate synthase [Nitrospira sp.]